MEHLAKIPKGISPDPIFAQMQKIEALKDQVAADLENVEMSEGHVEVPVALKDYKNYLKGVRGLKLSEGNTKVKRKIVERLIQKVEVLKDGFKLHYHVGASVFEKGPHKDYGLEEGEKKGSQADACSQSLFFKKNGSNTLTNGWFILQRSNIPKLFKIKLAWASKGFKLICSKPF